MTPDKKREPYKEHDSSDLPHTFSMERHHHDSERLGTVVTPLAALKDSYPKVKQYAFQQLAKYEWQDLKAVLQKPEDIVQEAINILKDENVDSGVRSDAAAALENLGEAGAWASPISSTSLKMKMLTQEFVTMQQ
jgi:hypothetical protein